MFYSAGSSNAASYAQAGRAAVTSSQKAFRAARENSPDYTNLAKTAMNNRSAEKITSMRAEEAVTRAGISAVSCAKQSEIKARTKNKIDKMKNKQRMAGGIAALGKIAGAGYLAFKDNTKDRKYPTADRSSIYEDFKNKRDALIQERESQRGTYKPTEFDPQDSSFSSSSVPSGSNSQNSSVSSVTRSGNSGSTGGTAGKATNAGQSLLTGNQKVVADAIARYESGDWGYEAFNQGGAAGGTKVLGKSGSHKEHFGKSLTDLTLGEIFNRQNTEQRGLSMQQHIDSGGLHAVGRYQFIGSTLQDEVRRMGLPLDTKFTPQVQDQIFINHIKRVGNISPWVGPSNNYNQAEKANFRNMISQF